MRQIRIGATGGEVVRLIGHVTRTTVYALVGGVILVALLMSAARVVLPALQSYRSDFETQLGRYLGRPVSIRRISAGMRGFRPELVLRDVAVQAAGGESDGLAFREMRVGLNVMTLLSSGVFQARWVSVVDADLSIVLERDGSIHIGGLDTDDEPPRWLFQDGRRDLLSSRIRWQNRKRGGPVLEFSDADVRIVNDGDHHRIAMMLDLPEKWGGSLDLRLQYGGDLFRPGCCSGVIYAEGKGVELGPLFQGEHPYGYSIRRGRSDFRLWSRWRDARLVQIGGDFELTRLQIDATTGAGPDHTNRVALAHAGGRMHWRQTTHGWDLSLDRLSLRFDDVAWPTARIRIATDRASDPATQRIRLAASFLRLEDVGPLLRALGAPLGLDSSIATRTALRGELRDLKLIADTGPTGPTHLALCAGFSGIGMNSWQRIPALDGLSGRLCGDEHKGRLTLTTVDATLRAPDLFRHPITIDRLGGTFNWHRRPDGWLLDAPRVQLETPDLTTLSRVRLQWPEEGGAPLLDVQSAFSSQRIGQLHRYIPVSIAARNDSDRLDQALAAGRLIHGRALVYGRFDRFPFSAGDGVVQVRFDVDGLEAKLDSEWPALTDVNGSVALDNDRLTMTARGGRLLGSTLVEGRIDLTRLMDSQPMRVNAIFEGRIGQALNELVKTPWRDRIEPLVARASVSGRYRLDLSLDGALGKEQPLQMNGTVGLKQARLRFPVQELDLTGMEGVVRFDRTGIKGGTLAASLAGVPARVELVEHGGRVVAELRGQVPVERVAEVMPAVLQSRVEGEMAVRADVRLVNPDATDRSAIDLTVRSDLTGVAVRLPAPLGKTRAVARPFSVSLRLIDGARVPLSLAYGDVLRAQVSLTRRADADGLEIESGSVVVGGSQAVVSAGPGLSLAAQIKDLHIDQWVDLWQAAADGANGWFRTVRRIVLSSGRTWWYQQNLGRLSMQLERAGDGWTGQMDSSIARGRIRWPAARTDRSVLALDLDHLVIPKQPDKRPAETVAGTEIDPRRLPDMNITSQHLRWRGVEFGRLELKTTQRAYGQHVDRLDVLSDNHRLTLSGDWKYTDFYDSTRVSGEMSVNDVGLFLKSVGRPNVISQTRGRFDFSLSWPGAPYRPAAAHLSGDINMKFGAGRLLTVEPGVGRALGMFNIDALKRMLLFDLSHLFGQGLAYDSVKGSIRLNDGTATMERFVIDGVPVRIEIDGRIGLAAEELDSVVTVTSKPGAPLGMAVRLAQQLTINAVKGITRKKYSVTGRWDDPVIARLPVERGWLQKAWSGLTGSRVDQ